MKKKKRTDFFVFSLWPQHHWTKWSIIMCSLLFYVLFNFQVCVTNNSAVAFIHTFYLLQNNVRRIRIATETYHLFIYGYECLITHSGFQLVWKSKEGREVFGGNQCLEHLRTSNQLLTFRKTIEIEIKNHRLSIQAKLANIDKLFNWLIWKFECEKVCSKMDSSTLSRRKKHLWRHLQKHWKYM